MRRELRRILLGDQVRLALHRVVALPPALHGIASLAGEVTVTKMEVHLQDIDVNRCVQDRKDFRCNEYLEREWCFLLPWLRCVLTDAEMKVFEGQE